MRFLNALTGFLIGCLVFLKKMKGRTHSTVFWSNMRIQRDSTYVLNIPTISVKCSEKFAMRNRSTNLAINLEYCFVGLQDRIMWTAITLSSGPIFNFTSLCSILALTNNLSPYHIISIRALVRYAFQWRKG